MKGISKYIDDKTKEVSLNMVGVQYRGILSTKMKTNDYLIKDKSIHFNDNLCRSLLHEKDRLKDIIQQAIISINNTSNVSEVM